VVLFHTWIDLFGDLFAGQAAGKTARDCSGHGSDGARRHAGRGPGRRAADCRSNARADWMGTRFAGDRIAVLVEIDIGSGRCHDVIS
jgi:hypothetical protein